MTSLSDAIFGKYIITILLSCGATVLSFFTLFGCDYVRLNFAALSDKFDFFTEPSWFGLGFLTHQNFDEGKNILTWNLSPKCYFYDEVGVDMFRSSSLGSGSVLAICSTGCSTAVLLLTILTLFYTGRKCVAIHAMTILLSILSVVYQLIVIVLAFDDENGGVCDPSSYGDNWYDKFPSEKYSNIRYMQFFSECTRGSTFNLAVAAMITESAVAVSIMVSLYLSYISSKAVKEGPKPTNTREISFPINDVELENVENPLPLLKSQEIDVDVEAGGTIMYDNKNVNDDDISYDNEEGSIEDKITQDDDIEIAPDDESEGDVMKEGEASVGTVKMFSMRSGRF
jgi:hypothetical protein